MLRTARKLMLVVDRKMRMSSPCLFFSAAL
jgi:hypothetical protein